MFKEREQQKTGPTHQEAEVLQEKHETRSVGLHSIHLWKLMKERKQEWEQNLQQFGRNMGQGWHYFLAVLLPSNPMKRTLGNKLYHLSVLSSFPTEDLNLKPAYKHAKCSPRLNWNTAVLWVFMEFVERINKEYHKLYPLRNPAHHFHQWQIEKNPSSDGEDPLLHFCLRGNKEPDVEAHEGRQRAEKVHQHSSLHWESRAEQHCKVPLDTTNVSQSGTAFSKRQQNVSKKKRWPLTHLVWNLVTQDGHGGRYSSLRWRGESCPNSQAICKVMKTVSHDYHQG